MKTWKEKIGKRLLKHVVGSTQRGTLRELMANLAAQRASGDLCFHCELAAQKLGLPPDSEGVKGLNRHQELQA